VKLTDLKILSCELHKNAFRGQTSPKPAGSYSAHPDPLAVIRGREGEGEGEGKGSEL